MGEAGLAIGHEPVPSLAVSPSGPGGWFQSMKPYCNPVEVETRMRWNPPPETDEGSAFKAACYALAGRVDMARQVILTLPGDEQWRAAGVVFNVGHPVADAGDDLSASAIMEMVVEFWPNHYMALYHAGAARFGLGQTDLAEGYLRTFLEEYGHDDGWTTAARSMLSEIEGR